MVVVKLRRFREAPWIHWKLRLAGLVGVCGRQSDGMSRTKAEPKQNNRTEESGQRDSRARQMELDKRMESVTGRGGTPTVSQTLHFG